MHSHIDINKAQQKKLIGFLDDLHGKHRALPSWDQKLKEAQKVLFNHELFSQVSTTNTVSRQAVSVVCNTCVLYMQLSRDAYHQKAIFPYEILLDQIHIPVR